MSSHATDGLRDALLGLENVRDSLLGRSQQAGSMGDWPTARKLVDLAERADALREEIEALTTGAAKVRPVRRSQGAGASTEEVLAAGTGDTKAFPRFAVRGGVLVKQGLKRNGREVYEHAVPRDHFEQIIAWLARLAANHAGGRRKPFSLEDAQRGLPGVPGYRLYVAIGLLLREGLLYRVRKGAYLFAAPADFAARAAGIWDELEKRAGN